MIFIVGGVYQGKREYALENYQDNYNIIEGYQHKVREQLRAKKDPIKEAEKFLEENSRENTGELVIISDEVGCGLVSVDAFEREYTEQTGRVNCYLAEHANQVIRVICGIGKRIK